MYYFKRTGVFLLDLLLAILTFSFVLILNTLPRKYALKLCKLVTKIILILIPRSIYVAKRNLSLMFPNMSSEEKNTIIEKHIETLAKNILGFAIGPKITKEEAHEMLDISECNEVIDEIKNHTDECGILILIPHFGPFELINHLWTFRAKKYSILARPFGLPILDLFWNSQREATGNEIFGRKGGFSEIVKKLKEGHNVVLLFDQNVKRSHGMFVPFFGHNASTTKTIALASLRTGCKIVLASMIETSPFKFKLKATWIKGPRDRKGTADERTRDTLIDANLALEELIKENPHEWFLVHRRFKTRPKGEPENWYNQDLYPER